MILYGSNTITSESFMMQDNSVIADDMHSISIIHTTHFVYILDKRLPATLGAIAEDQTRLPRVNLLTGSLSIIFGERT